MANFLVLGLHSRTMSGNGEVEGSLADVLAAGIVTSRKEREKSNPWPGELANLRVFRAVVFICSEFNKVNFRV